MGNSRIALGLGGLLLTCSTLACAGAEHPAYADPDAKTPGAGGSDDVPNVSTGGASDSFQGTPELPDPGAGFDSGNFGRGEVYLLGQIREPVDAGWAIAHLPTPQSYITGFEPYANTNVFYGPLRTFAFADSSLRYASTALDWDGSARTFVVDGSGTGELTEPYPDTPEANDLVVDTPHCPADVQGLVTSPNGRMIYRCGASDWYEGDELVLQHADVFLLTDGGTAMYADALPMNIAELGSSDSIAVQVSFLSAARVVGEDFHAAVLRSDSAYELVEVHRDGSYKSLDIYKAGSDAVIRSAVLSGNDDLYQLGGNLNAPPFQLKRFTRGGRIEIALARGKGAIEPILLMSP